MTHPTDPEVASQLHPRLHDSSIILSVEKQKEIAALLQRLAKYLMVPDIQLGIIPSKNRKLADEARAMADQLSPPEQT